MYETGNGPDSLATSIAVLSAEEIARRIRAARAYAGLSTAALAERIGLGTQTIKRIEAERRIARRFELWAIAEACGMPRAFFEHDLDDMFREAALSREILRAVEERLARIEEASGPGRPRAVTTLRT